FLVEERHTAQAILALEKADFMHHVLSYSKYAVGALVFARHYDDRVRAAIGLFRQLLQYSPPPIGLLCEFERSDAHVALYMRLHLSPIWAAAMANEHAAGGCGRINQ